MPDLFHPPVVSGRGRAVTVNWGYPMNTTSAILDGMTQDFNWFPIQTMDDRTECMVQITGKDATTVYIQFRLRYFLNGIYVGESKSAWNPYARTGISHINLAACRSYKGVTISFRDHIIYDRYCLYEIENDITTLVAEGEDFQMSSNFKENGIYYVEAYKKDEKTEELVLAGVSDLWPLSFYEPVRHTPVVSVVIPVWNVPYLISRTLDALVLQSLPDIEVIAVDDVCTDSTPSILAWYAEHYPFIKIITHTENKYVSGTRNDGIAAATTDLIAVHDNDDMMHFDMLRLLRKAILETGADIAVCRTVEHREFNDSHVILDRKPTDNQWVETFSYQEMQKQRGKHGNIYFVAVWNKLCRRSILEKVYYPDNEHGYVNQKYEDSAYTAALYSHAEKIAMVHGTWYMWEKRLRQTTGSLTMTGAKKHNMTQPEIWKHWSIANLQFPLRMGSEKNRDLLQYTQIKEVLDRAERLKYWENKSDIQKTVTWYIKDGMREFELLKNPLIQSDSEIMRKLLLINSLKTEKVV